MKTKNTNAALSNIELEEELVGILTAISVVSKRLAKKLLTLQTQADTSEEGGKANEQNERNGHDHRRATPRRCCY
jgi:hypothetical protein